MKFEEVLHGLNTKVYSPIYLLMGEEPYFIDKISDFIENNVLSEAEKEFNQNILYAKDIDEETIISYAKSYPMLANYRVVIVKEAQNLSKIDKFQNYAEKPQKSTILVLCYKYKTLDKRKSLFKAISKVGVVFESDKIYENKIPQWIEGYVKNKNVTIDPKASTILAEYLGNDLSKISNEIDKMIINIGENKKITAKEIEENIGISKDFNVFELQKALGNKEIFKANQIANYFAANSKNNPLVMVITLLYSYFMKLLIYYSLSDKSRSNVASSLSISPYLLDDYLKAARNYPMNKLIDIIAVLREYDAKVKGIDNNSTNEGELLKELIFKIVY